MNLPEPTLNTFAPLHRFVEDYDCPILSIGERKGFWGYIDFIEECELKNDAVIKGADCIGRPFIAIKAEFVLENGETVATFATLFQKYVNNKNIWQCFNYAGKEMLKTSYIGDGFPVTEKQIMLLQTLITERHIELTDLTDVAHHDTVTPIQGLRLRSQRISICF